MTIHPRKSAFILITIALSLSVISLLTEYLVEVVYKDLEHIIIDILNLFSVNLETSIPTWYSSILLFIASMILMQIAYHQWQTTRHYIWHWAGLAGIFLYLSMDEGAEIHEIASSLTTTTGHLAFGWLIVFVPLVLVIVLAYIGFVWQLPFRTRIGFIIAGLVYVGGAVVVESLSANQYFLANGDYTYTYLAIATIEETMEMIGVIVLIYTLLSYRTVNVHITATQDKHQQTTTTFDDSINTLFLHIRQSSLLRGVWFIGLGIHLTSIYWVAIRESTTTSILAIVISLMVGIALGSVTYRLSGSSINLISPLISGVSIIVLIILSLFGIPFTTFYYGGTPLYLLFPIILTALYSSYLLHTSWQASTLAILGLCVGIVILMLFDGLDRTLILTFGMVVVLALLGHTTISSIGWLRLVIISAGVVWFFPLIDGGLLAQRYITHDTLPATTQTILSDYSRFQRIDVLQDDGGNRYLQVDGIPYFNPIDDSLTPILMGRVPASLIRPDHVWVWGANSLQRELMIANYSQQVTTVEPDATLIAISKQYFASYNQQERLTNSDFVIRYFANYIQETSQSVDLVTIDRPFEAVHDAYSVTLFANIADKLVDQGVLVMDLGGILTPDNREVRQLMADILEVFSDAIVITVSPANRSYAYVSPVKLPFSRDDLQQAITAHSNLSVGIFELNAIKAIVGQP